MRLIARRGAEAPPAPRPDGVVGDPDRRLGHRHRDRPHRPPRRRTLRTTARRADARTSRPTPSCSRGSARSTAILIGSAAGTQDVSNGVFRDLVVTGRPRSTLFDVRIPGALIVFGRCSPSAGSWRSPSSTLLAGTNASPSGSYVWHTIVYVVSYTGLEPDPGDRHRRVHKLAGRRRRADRVELDRLAPADRRSMRSAAPAS